MNNLVERIYLGRELNEVFSKREIRKHRSEALRESFKEKCGSDWFYIADHLEREPKGDYTEINLVVIFEKREKP